MILFQTTMDYQYLYSPLLGMSTPIHAQLQILFHWEIPAIY